MLYTLSQPAHTFLNTYVLIGFTVTGLSLLRSVVKHQYSGPLKIFWEQIQHLRQDLQAKAERIHGLKDLVYRSNQERDRYRLEAVQLREQLEQLTLAHQDLGDRHQDLGQQAQEQLAQIQQVEAFCHDLKAQLERATIENEQLRQTCQEQVQELEALHIQREQLTADYQEQLRQQTEALEIERQQLQAHYEEQALAQNEKERQLAQADQALSLEREQFQKSLGEREETIAHLRQDIDRLTVVNRTKERAVYQLGIYQRWLGSLTTLMTSVVLIYAGGPWSPLRTVWESIYPHLPFLH
ncbi:hypothetical protein L3556_14645 [Candidatus Synechococcus calcipolaris G9]|uniref:Chromosome partition protein Smc n=1 Tax=Candidatus Synechococcus calcipolaris G9 TaxID=1497997 RepID=A0ABT6F2W0_9SYNE|nr:hypothetical protein [Candidatus Synechococcus calcipolaris]MDG2992159.1 hypothetical protein [Candidatus Synechococcus calcipolaris G9]